MDYVNLVEKAKQMVSEYTNGNLEPFELTAGIHIKPDDVYVVWYCKTLQNAKVLLSTPLPDGMYYEVTYNGNKDEIYFDAYEKVENIKFEGGKY